MSEDGVYARCQVILNLRLMCLSLQMSAVVLPGYHVVKVTVANHLGNVSAVLNVSVLHPVTICHITAKPVTLGRPFVLEAVISGDLDFALSVDFGDGSYVNGSAAGPHPDIHVIPYSHASCYRSTPVYLLKLRHDYVTPGDYVVSLSVTNKVSYVTKLLTANVTNDDFNITLRADRQSPISSNSLITLRAEVTTDDDVSFNWTCDRCASKPLFHGSVLFFAEHDQFSK